MSSHLAPVPDRPPRAIAYVRVSDERGRGDALLSPQIQLNAIREHCDRSGYDLVRVLEDVDLTGRFWKRRQVEQAVAAIEGGDADVLVVWKVSRVARNRRDWAIAVDRIEGAGGRLESATEPNDPTASGRFARGVLAELAAFESERIGETWREVQRDRFERGLPVNGATPWGWSWRDGALVADPDRGRVIVEAYRRYLAGDGMVAIATWLNDAGWPSASGARWHPTTVRGLLDNPIHAGLVRYKGQTRPGAHTALVDEATWREYQAARRRRAHGSRAEASKSWLARLCRCGICGGYMAMNAMSKNGRTYAVYRCDAAAHSRAHRHASLSSRRVESAVLAWLADVAAERIDAEEPAPPPDTRVRAVERLEEQLAAVERSLTNLTVQFAAGVVPQGAYEAARDRISADHARLAQALQAARDEVALAPAVLAPAARSLLDEWDELPVARRREALARMIRRVIVTPGPDWAVEVESVPSL